VTTWNLVLVLIGVYITLPVVCGPFLLRKNLRLTKPVHGKKTGEKEIPYGVYERIQETSAELEALGYRFVGYGTYDAPILHATAQCGLFRNETTKTLAIVAAILSQAGMADVYEEIHSAHASGIVITTNNSAARGPYKHPQKRHYHFPDVIDVQRLHAMHQWIVQHSAAVGDPVLPCPGEELTMLYQEGVGDIAQQEQNGSLYWDHTIGQYRPTWWGAIQFTLSRSFPLRQLRAHFSALEARRAIANMPEVTPETKEAPNSY
jgi:hypothetical protein